MIKHDGTECHVTSCNVYDQWRLHGTIDEVSEQKIREQVNFWRQVLDRFINVTLTLVSNNLAFGGHFENNESVNKCNFLSIIDQLAMYDPLLKELLSRPAGSVKYLSPEIQNELIDILFESVQKEIISEIKAAPFF